MKPSKRKSKRRGYLGKICMMCEEPMYYIPLGQRHKPKTSDTFYHNRCVDQ